MESTPLTLSQILALMRVQAGMTQADLGAELGVHKNTIANLENGRQNPLGKFDERTTWLQKVEEATGKPEGWAEAFVDPLSFIMRQQDDIEHIKAQVDEILKLLKVVRDGTVKARKSR